MCNALVLAAILAFPSAGAATHSGGPARIDTAPINEAAVPKMRLEILSPRVLTPTNMSPEALNRALTGSTPHYAIETNDRFLILDTAKLLSRLQLIQRDSLPERTDLRYRLTVFDGDRRLLVLYFGSNGELVYRDLVFLPRVGKAWIKDLWKTIRAERFYGPWP